MVVALDVTAPVADLATGWSHLGDRNGLAGLGALLAAAVVFTWSVRRPARILSEFGLLVPVAVLGFVIAESLPTPYAMWAWLVAAGVLAAVVQVGPIRRRLTVDPLLAGSASLLAVGLAAAWAFDGSLAAVIDHGTTAGWESIAIATGAAFLLALAVGEPSARSHALWLPFLLAAQLCTMLLPGQYPLVAVAGLSALASAAAITWPSPVRGRLDRAAVSAIGILSCGRGGGSSCFSSTRPRACSSRRRTRRPRAWRPRSPRPPRSCLRPAQPGTCRGRHAASRPRCSRSTPPARSRCGRSPPRSSAPSSCSPTPERSRRCTITSSRDTCSSRSAGCSSVSGWSSLSLRGNSRSLRAGGITLLFVALGKLFLYDLAFLTAMARAVSFIVTGSVLLLAALLLQRFAPQVKAALGDEPPEALA